MQDRKPLRLYKRFGQHLLHDTNIAQKIVATLNTTSKHGAIVEVGPGQGSLTQWLVKREPTPIYLIEIDTRFIPYLEEKYASPHVQVVQADFLTFPLQQIKPCPIRLIGNFPYNISSQIFFKVLEHKDVVQEVVCTLQHEVAKRIASPPNCKTYGILSVLLQAFYQVKYCFSIAANAFTPPPKVTSGVLHLVQKQTKLPCNEVLFFNLVRTSFQQRRKMMRNALSPLNKDLQHLPEDLLRKRPENLTVEDFVYLAQKLSE